MPTVPFRRRVLALAFALLCLGFVQTAQAEMSANEILASHARGGEVANLAEVILDANLNGIEWSNAIIRQQQGQPLYCSPSDLVLQGAALIALLKEDIALNPQTGELPYGLAIIIAMRNTFPC